MGTLETQSRAKRKRIDLTKVILATIKVAGVLSVALVAPNALQGLSKLGIIPSRRQGEYLRSAQRRLVSRGLLLHDGSRLRLSKKGEEALREHERRSYAIARPRNWDHRWRVLIFDIPERKRQVRIRLVSLLRSAGLVRLQDSVWVHPYDCEDMLQLLKTDLGVRRDVLYIIADTIENDRHLREHFGLSRD